MKKNIAVLLAFLATPLLLVNSQRYLTRAEEDMIPSEVDGLPYTFDEGLAYGQTNHEIITPSSSDSLPVGYSGKVLKLYGGGCTDATGIGVVLDYSSLKIDINKIESITFNVYGGVNEYRIFNTGKKWASRVPVIDKNNWQTIRLSKTENFVSGFGFESISNTDSTLGKFEICCNHITSMYLDFIEIKFSENGKQEEEEIEFNDAFPVVKSVSGVSAYPSVLPTLLSEEDAIKEVVPTGYSGEVLKLSSTNPNMGITFDYSNQEIITGLIESMTIRMYLVSTGSESSSYPEARITNTGGTGKNEGWGMRYFCGNKVDKWFDITLNPSAEITNFYKNADFSYFANEDGYMGLFEFSIRNTKATTLYIDYISFTMKEGDKVAPVIMYNGENEITIPYGHNFSLDINAFDEFENRNVDVEIIFPEDSLDENGNLKIGSWTIKYVATDASNNSSFIVVSITVIEPDTEAPIINCKISRITVAVGTIPQLNIKISDNYNTVDQLTIIETWSEDALDNYGRLVKGEHNYTITVTDLSMNQSSHTIIFFVR